MAREEQEPAASSNDKGFSIVASTKKRADRNSERMMSSISMPKKRKAMSKYVDHELDDTATSPVHRLKEEKGDVASGQTRTESDHNLHFAEKDNSSMCTELRKKGLCLVPVSLLLKELPYLKY
ncbi:hypothetical protein AKJ16_DCAP06029 [Drosera capensis]